MYLERLIRAAEALLQAGEELPLDLLVALDAAGIDLSTFDH
jgi:hypothetical protein